MDGIRRRGVTVAAGGVLVSAMTWLGLHAQVPYVQLEPGPSYDTLGKDDHGNDVIVLNGVTATHSTGQLRFLTIVIRPKLTLLEALEGWWNSDESVVPAELYFPPGKSEDQINKQNAQDFANSISSAQTAALTHLGYPPHVSVKDVTRGGPADGKLNTGDVIKTVDSTAIDSVDALVAQLKAKPAGTTFTFGITRNGHPMTVQIASVAGSDGVPSIGVAGGTTSSAPFTISIPIENIGGPSAGLMLTLGIIDKVEPEDLTGGKIIAGTGSIDTAGHVGPIGGLPQKLVEAKAAHATYFLTPKDNCAEGVANQKPGLPLVQVSTLDDALTALADIRSGTPPPLCPGAHP
jgi:PDZ domain-containing protein